MKRQLRSVALWACAAVTANLALSACGDDTKPGVSSNAANANCSASVLEPDLQADSAQGAGVDPSTGKPKLEAGARYVVSSTYGAPVPGADGAPASDRYLELFAGIQQQLEQQPGLIALQLGQSDACGSGRTLAIWKSEEEMYSFVTSPAHAAAMRAAPEILKPGYAVTHWETTSPEQMTFAEAVRRLAAER